MDVFNCDQAEAANRLLSAVKDGRMKPDRPPIFPGQPAQRETPAQVPFPKTPGEVTTQPAIPQPAQKTLTAAKRRRLAERIGILDSERTTRVEKLTPLSSALAIETNEAIKFQLQKQIQAEQERITQLERELEEIEITLESE